MSSNHGLRSLTSMTELRILEALHNDLDEATRNVTFACGGFIPLDGRRPLRSASFTSSKRRALSSSGSFDSVVVRYDRKGGEYGKIAFPAASEDTLMKTLIASCEPARFGKGHEDVYDEKHRRALKLEATEFSTSFCPYRTGIIDVVTQMLLPGVNSHHERPNNQEGAEWDREQLSINRGLRAEPYKLNVYSGPSGMFKPHIDTPRSEHQIGSLVVALPTEFEGGQLEVRGSTNTVSFDWSTRAEWSNSAVHWAAFYSDCVHEIKEVTSGHRVTLTYNLFVSQGTGMLAGKSLRSLDRTKLPLYASLRNMLQVDAFLHTGAILGFYLHHAYPHADPVLYRSLPAALEGVDMILYECVRALGLKYELVPIMTGLNALEPGTEDLGFEDQGSEDDYGGGESRPTKGGVDSLRVFRTHRVRHGQILQPATIDDEMHGEGEGATKWGVVRPSSDILWMTTLRHKQRQTAFMEIHGNEGVTMEVKYTFAALLVHVPPAWNRT